MIPTINKRFLLKLSVVVLALAGLLVGAHTLQASRIPEALKSQAERAEELIAGDPKKADQAIHYLRQYLEFRPQDVDAQEKLANLLRARSNEPSSLLRLYDSILRNDPTRHDTRREALKASLRIGRYTDAETHALALVKEFPKEPQVRLDLAFAQRGLQKQAEARESYQLAIDADPTAPGAYQEYAEFLVNEAKQKDEAKKVLDRLIAARPRDPESYNARGRFYALLEAETSAIADARKSLELDPQNADAMLLLGEQLQRGKDIPAAADLFRDGTKVFPSDPRFVRNLAWLEVNRGNSGQAVAALEDGMARVSEKDAFDLLVPLADLLIQMRDSERSAELLAKLEKRTESDPRRVRTTKMQVLYLQGRIAMSRADWPESISKLTALRNDCGELLGLECQVNLLLSVSFQRSGEFDREEEVLKVLLGKDPNHNAARVTLGQAYLNAGRFDEAIAEYEIASKNRFAAAETRATLLKMKASRLRVHGATQRDWDDLDAQARAYAPYFGTSNSDFGILRAELFKARRALPQAIAALRDEAQRRPTEARIWAGYSQVGAEFAGVSAGLSVLDEAQALCGDRPELRLARANLYARDPARLRSLDPLAAQIDTWPEGDQNKVLYGLVEIYDRLGDDAGVVRTYRRIAGRYPTDTTVWEGLFDRATRSGDRKLADEARTMLLKLEPVPGKSAALLNAWDVANARRANDAPDAIAALIQQFGSNPVRAEACIALARLQLLAGGSTTAGPLLYRAVRLEPTRFGPTQEYLQYLTSTGQDDRLAKLLSKLFQHHAWSGEPLRRAVFQTVQRVEPAAAKRLLDQVRSTIEKEPSGLGWLSDCYRAAGFQTDAIDCEEKACLTPFATPDDWMRKIVRRAERGNADSAIEALAEAKTKLASAQLYLMTAAVFADSTAAPKDWKLKVESEADRKQYTQARLAVKLSRFQKNEAITLLEDYLAEGAATKAGTAWARRNLAMMLVARGSELDRKRAKELLTGEEVTTGESADDKRSTAAVLAQLSRQIEGGDREKVLDRAIAILSEVSSETKNPRDRFLLSQLYRSAGTLSNPDRARETRAEGRKLLQELIRDDSKNIEYYVAALNEATEPEDLQFAEKCAAFLINNHPSDYRVVQAVSRFECRANRPEKALAQVIAYARTADSTPGDLQTRSARAAELLDEFGRMPSIRGTTIGRKMTDAAVEKYEGLFAFRPEAIIAIAGLLATDGRTAEAFQRIEKQSRKLPARVKVLAGLAALRTGGESERDYRTVREWLNIAKNEEPGSVAVLMNEGELCTLQGDVAGAEKAYAAAVEIDDQSVVGLNNLAWILAAKPDSSERALELVERAVRQIGYTGDLLDTRARVKIAQKEYESAERDLTSAIKLESTPLRLFHLALAEKALGGMKTEGAKTHFAEALQKGLSRRTVHPADIKAFEEFGGK